MNIQRTLWVVAMAMFLGCGGGGDDGGQFNSLSGDDDFIDLTEWASTGGDLNVFADFDADLDNRLNPEEYAGLASAGEDYVACSPALCDDGNSCTDEVCEVGSCLNVINIANACDDGDHCTTSEYCHDDGECRVEGDGKSGTETCGFNEALKGKNIGQHVKNFGMKTHDDCPYWLHQNCGTNTKLIWMILSTGW